MRALLLRTRTNCHSFLPPICEASVTRPDDRTPPLTALLGYLLSLRRELLEPLVPRARKRRRRGRLRTRAIQVEEPLARLLSRVDGEAHLMVGRRDDELRGAGRRAVRGGGGEVRDGTEVTWGRGLPWGKGAR